MTYWLAFTFKKVTDIIEWLVIFLSQWWEGQLTVAVLWPIDWLTHWLYYPGTAQLTEWFMADWLTDWLTDSTFWGLTKWFNDFWLIELSGYWPSDWMIYGWLIDWATDSTVWGLTNWLNDLWLIDWLSNWLYCPGADQLTEWFMADWLTE